MGDSYGGKYWSIPGIVASATSLATKQYYVVQLTTTAGQVKLASTPASDKICGILQNNPAAGEVAEVAFSGICKGSAEGAISRGDFLTTNSTGQLQTTTTDKDEVVGLALEAATTQNDVIPVLLTRFTLSA